MAVQTLKASGALAQFKTPSPVDITSCKVYFSPKQSGSGDPSPSNVRPISGWTGCKVYWTKTNLFPEAMLANFENYANVGNYGYLYTNPIYLTPNTVYHLDWTRKTSNSDPNCLWGIKIYPDMDYGVTDTGTFQYYCNGANGFKSYASFNSGPTGIIRFALNKQLYSTGQDALDDLFAKATFMLTVGTTATPYEPYSGTTYPITFPAVGKNKFDYANTTITNYAIRTDDGSYKYDSTQSYTDTPIPVIPNTTYTVSGFTSENTRRIYYLDQSQNWIERTGTFGGTTVFTKTFTTPNNCYYIQLQSGHIGREDWSSVQLELGDTATAYESFNNTIYGGYVDLVSGEVVREYRKLDLSTFNINYVFSNDVVIGGAIRVTHAQYQNIDSSFVLCDKLPTRMDYDAQPPFIYVHEDEGNNRMYVAFMLFNKADYPNASESDIKSMTAAYLNNNITSIVAKRPFNEYSILPTTLKTLAGSNSFWSNADSVEVEYELTEPGYIRQARKRMLQNVPHLVSASGGIASFNTNMRAKLKECKVSFEPVQAGTGEPSPTNIREISGFTGLNVTHCGKNLLSINDFAGEDITITNGVATGTANAFNAKFSHNNTYLFNRFGSGIYTLSVTAYTNGNASTLDTNGLLFRMYYTNNTTSAIQFKNSDTTSTTKTLVSTNGKTISKLIVTYSNAGANVWNITNVMLEKAESTIYTPYTGTTYPISWQSSAGTAYAGYLDLKTGILTVTQGVVTMDGTGSTNEGKSFYGKAGTTKNIQFYTYIGDLNYYHPSETGNRPDGVCNMAHTITRDEATGQDFTMPTGIDVGYETFVNPANNKYTKRITFPLDTEIDTLEKANNWIAGLYANGTPLQFTYTFGTPVTYQLDPVDIVTLKGVNNVRSDVGNVEVKYWKH